MVDELRKFDKDIPCLDGKTVLITGGTGSFGTRCVKELLDRFDLKRLIVFSRDELKQYEMAQQFPQSTYPCMRYFIGDVRDCERLRMAMRGVDIVIHAAAMKHVTAAEYNPFECIHTNVIGAENIVKASIDTGVKQVIALSTDKAASPANLYGASKLASDKIFVAANNLAGEGGPDFCVVRYGNVVGSRGSVVPLFKNLIRNNTDALPITHPDMTRFWITLDQGVNFVLSCLGQMSGGEIFIPKIPSMKMVDLAKALAPELPIKIIGIRPGEKLHEVMVTEDDARHTVESNDRYAILPDMDMWRESSAKGIPDGYKAVRDDFHYSSDSNSEWLDAGGLMKMIG
ncbi:UDP-N-acetylglucosamine 4,6-dehydratase (inverting) [Thalassospira povalilytica]|uniref:UDP-N-acetylglucosamine 4,6-dehydratase (inverting) n=1 Tax=Thalassospira povalilytica TaxID=732237 RepID=UPI001D196764|nr:UDP-N-acetylglucosamine 4,6-dehydratase (inverting) [Thalassospira povalilytica]MCC4241912.1 UDP-N-acetylglucosamine 4,6-dehydratase (inverting) [Thalassospira povalilytica]